MEMQIASAKPGKLGSTGGAVKKQNTERVPDPSKQDRMEKENDQHGDVLDMQTDSVEGQLELLSSKVLALTTALHDETQNSVKLQGYLAEAHNALEVAKAEQEELRSVFEANAASPLLAVPSGNLSSARKRHQNLVQVEKLQKLLQHERQQNHFLRTQYENHLRNLRKLGLEDRIAIRSSVLQQVDGAIRKYRELAKQAVEVAHAERRIVQQDRKKAKELAEQACKHFEHDIKERTKHALEEYRAIADRMHRAAMKERNELREKCAELEVVIDKERRTFECEVLREAEQYASTYRKEAEQLKEQQVARDRAFSLLIDDIRCKVEKECKLFEGSWLSGTVKLLASFNISMSEVAVRKFLEENANSQKAAPTDVIKPIAEESSSKETIIRYGFRAVEN